MSHFFFFRWRRDLCEPLLGDAREGWVRLGGELSSSLSIVREHILEYENTFFSTNTHYLVQEHILHDISMRRSSVMPGRDAWGCVVARSGGRAIYVIMRSYIYTCVACVCVCRERERGGGRERDWEGAGRCVDWAGVGVSTAREGGV